MSDKGILFSGAMVCALLDGTKTQTRRAIRLEAAGKIVEFVRVARDAKTGRAIYEMKDAGGGFVQIPAGKNFVTPHFSPPYAVGDRLWVREAFAKAPPHGVRYAATDAIHDLRVRKPGMYMPRWASRLTLIVTDVRVERLQAITEADAIAEGVGRGTLGDMRDSLTDDAFAADPDDLTLYFDMVEDEFPLFRKATPAYAMLWDRINAENEETIGWRRNPWVIAYTFDVHRLNIDDLPAGNA